MSMEEALISVLSIFCGSGLLLLAVGIVIFVLEKKKKESCTERTDGTVVDYRFTNGVPCPVAEYTVNGISYRKKKSFRGIISVQTPGGNGKNQVYVDKNDVVHIRRGAFINMRRFAQELYPLGSFLAVWYDPANPRRAYVGKIPEKRTVTGIVFLWSGIGLVLLGLCVSALILFV